MPFACRLKSPFAALGLHPWLQVNNRRRGLNRKHRLQEEFGEPRGLAKIPAAVQMHDIPLGDKPDDKVNLFIDAHTNSKQGIAAAMHGRV